MKRRTIARAIAVILLSYGCAFLLVDGDRSDMVQYRSLSHEALLANLAQSHEADFSSSFGESLLVIGLAVLLVEAMAACLELAINRIAPPHPAGAPEPVADASGTRFH
jgi:hypothetical protein